MCRLVAYLGLPANLHQLVDDAPHSLAHQSYRARELETAVVCADGWGAAWYLPGDPVPCLYRSTAPIWGDVNRAHLGRAARSHCLLAAVRSATDPLSIAPANTQPFAWGPLAFLHNGYVADFAARVLRPLREQLSDARHRELAGSTDSEHLFALVVDAYERSRATAPGERLAFALRDGVGALLTLVRELGVRALATVVLSDGDSVAALRLAEGGAPPSLYVQRTATERRPGSAIASEPLDDADWQLVPAGTGIVFHRDGSAQELAAA
jgi:glutamine amidotransferase